MRYMKQVKGGKEVLRNSISCMCRIGVEVSRDGDEKGVILNYARTNLALIPYLSAEAPIKLHRQSERHFRKQQQWRPLSRHIRSLLDFRSLEETLLILPQ